MDKKKIKFVTRPSELPGSDCLLVSKRRILV